MEPRAAARDFTVCALCYGDYPQLTHRLFSSLAPWKDHLHVRVGLNNVCEETRQTVADFKPQITLEGSSPYWKYPMMRRLLRVCDLETPYVMWFDDDSCIAPDAPADWFAQVRTALQTVKMVGSLWKMRVHPQQRLSVSREPWYTGRAVPEVVRFCTGGWWAIHTDVLQKHDWPIASLEHRGGDVLLGLLCDQQQYLITQFQQGVWINADATGRCSSSPRRGTDQAPWGMKGPIN